MLCFDCSRGMIYCGECDQEEYEQKKGEEEEKADRFLDPSCFMAAPHNHIYEYMNRYSSRRNEHGRRVI